MLEFRPPVAGVACALAFAAWSNSARADQDSWEGAYRVKTTRRGDFTAGIQGGPVLVTAHGYPNEASKIHNDAYVADTGIAPGTTYTVWLGGALRDWFTFAIGISRIRFVGNDLTGVGYGFLFRVETFPFFSLGGPWRDAGAYANFGLGGLTLDQDDKTKADGGALSIISLGAFYEPIRFGIFSFGPNIEYTHAYSRSFSMFGATAGARLVLYASP